MHKTYPSSLPKLLLMHLLFCGVVLAVALIFRISSYSLLVRFFHHGWMFIHNEYILVPGGKGHKQKSMGTITRLIRLWRRTQLVGRKRKWRAKNKSITDDESSTRPHIVRARCVREAAAASATKGESIRRRNFSTKVFCLPHIGQENVGNFTTSCQRNSTGV